MINISKRWIQHSKSEVKRGEGAPPSGDSLFFVGEDGAAALVRGVLYIDGKRAAAGMHEFQFLDGEVVTLEVDAYGRVLKDNLKKGDGGDE